MAPDASWSPGETLELTGSRRKWVVILAACVLFVGVAVGALVNGSTSWGAWATIVIFAPCGFVAGRQITVPNRLMITPTHLELDHVRRRVVRDLASCSEFDTWRNPSANRRMVVFDHPHDDAKPTAAEARALTGHSGSLPDTYGMRADDLADLLNRARRAARSN